MILTLLAAIGGAIAAAGTTVATTAATVGGAVAAGAAAAGGAIATGAAAVGSTVAAVGATEVVGSVTVAALAKGVAAVTAGGIALAAANDSGYQSGLTDGEKNGYAKASREYEAKFKSLRSQLNSANITISDQRRYIAELRELNTNMRGALEYYRAKGENVSGMELTSYNVSNLLERYAA